MNIYLQVPSHTHSHSQSHYSKYPLCVHENATLAGSAGSATTSASASASMQQEFNARCEKIEIHHTILYAKLLAKTLRLEKEVSRLTKENSTLKRKLGITKSSL
jgi:hypothetical protein